MMVPARLDPDIQERFPILPVPTHLDPRSPNLKTVKQEEKNFLFLKKVKTKTVDYKAEFERALYKLNSPFTREVVSPLPKLI